MNAGGCERGQYFAAKHCDIVHVVFGLHDFDDCKAKVDSYRKLARKECGREIQVWNYAYAVQGETEKEALNWPRYIEDQRWFKDRVYPLVVQAGLRRAVIIHEGG